MTVVPTVSGEIRTSLLEDPGRHRMGEYFTLGIKGRESGREEETSLTPGGALSRVPPRSDLF